MKDYIRFSCVYCGQHMECDPRLCGRQFHCPACRQRIVVPPPAGRQNRSLEGASNATWDSQVPAPAVETPTRYLNRNHARPAAAGRNVRGGGDMFRKGS